MPGNRRAPRAGCSALDWSKILVADGFDWRRIERSASFEDVVPGRFTGKVSVVEGLEQPTGSMTAVLPIHHWTRLLSSNESDCFGNVCWSASHRLELWPVVCQGMTTYGFPTR